MPPQRKYLKVYESGKLTVLGFGNIQTLDQVIVTECREEIAAIIKQHSCETLAFDLTGVKFIPSGMLGMLASLGRLGVEVFLFNPSDEIREMLEITRLDSVLQVHRVAV